MPQWQSLSELHELLEAITKKVAAEAAGEEPRVRQSYRFGFHRPGSVLRKLCCWSSCRGPSAWPASLARRRHGLRAAAISVATYHDFQPNRAD